MKRRVVKGARNLLEGDQLAFMIRYGPEKVFHHDSGSYRYFYVTDTPTSLSDYIAVVHRSCAPRGTTPIKHHK